MKEFIKKSFKFLLLIIIVCCFFISNKANSKTIDEVKKGAVKGEGVTISDLKKAFNDTQNTAYDVDVLLLYNNNVNVTTVMSAVKQLTTEYATVTAQKAVPAKLKYKSIAQLSADGSITFKEGNV